MHVTRGKYNYEDKKHIVGEEKNKVQREWLFILKDMSKWLWHENDVSWLGRWWCSAPLRENLEESERESKGSGEKMLP